MNYPIWQLDVFGGGFLIAVVATLHVYIAHFAVGGGLFLVLTEIKGHKEDSRGTIEFVRKHTKFFLLLTMVLGSLTGVGIWFTISLINPSATSILIHNFIFAWAIEWVFFVAEIVSLFIYYLTFDKMDNRNHIVIGWIYFGCAWMSLFFINGIVSFMLTPGSWLKDGSFWSGLFNPTFWPSLFFRSFLAIMIAGLFGFFTATRIKDPTLRNSIVRYCAIWLSAPFILLLGSAWWYIHALPKELATIIFHGMPALKPYFKDFVIISTLLVFSGLLMAIRLPQSIKQSMAAVMLLIGFLYISSFEFIREGGRRPYIIRDYMYSNSILKQDVKRTQQKGLLQEAKWVNHRTITDSNRLDAGREIFQISCLPCHSLGGPSNDIYKKTKKINFAGMKSFIGNMHIIYQFMPPFAGSEEEKDALAKYITSLHNN